MFTSLRRAGLASLCLLALSACNLDDVAPENQLAADGEACTSDDACASGLCLKGLKVCAATCEDTCEGDLVCSDGHCLPADYCDEGFGPGCAPTTCEPGCHADATCDLQATAGPTCVCNDGFEGDGLSCTIIETNPCLEDNGGCGDPGTVQCDAVEDDDSGELVAQCTIINPCLTDNGGCGDPEFFACTNAAVGEGVCSEVDLCATDNGGCGDPERYECVPVSGQAPLCKFVASCDVEHVVPLLEDTFTSFFEPLTSFAEKPFLVVNPPERSSTYRAVYEYTASQPHESYLSFDLRELPDGFPVIGARLNMVGFDGHAWGGNRDTYINLVSNEWRADELNWENAPETLAERLGFWFLWQNGNSPVERPVFAESAELASMIEERRADGVERVSLKLNAPGYTTIYYSSEHEEAEKRPRLTLTVRECNQPVLLPDANATVNNREPDTALGEGGGLVADRDRSEFYVRFDMSQIPVGSEIVGAQLELVAIDATSFGGDATFTLDYLTTEVWGEASVTYSSRPAAAGAELATFTVDTSETRDHAQRIILDTTELFETVAERFEAEQSISLRVAASGDAATFAGRNHSQTAWRPRLTVIYE
ncbi:hypothetical protein DV096_13860 [Bradymonadaceae bacterium TMQ3]|nr:hypothetical protein DV096_13860 [Bradymonadaceae bacterium TMQ3]TXC75137.1 DNRLRE domain-containing protein [Bradymonadales bacterium TMQ1]